MCYLRAGLLEAQGEEVCTTSRGSWGLAREPLLVHRVSQGGEAPCRGPLLDGKVGAIFLQLF